MHTASTRRVAGVFVAIGFGATMARLKGNSAGLRDILGERVRVSGAVLPGAVLAEIGLGIAGFAVAARHGRRPKPLTSGQSAGR